VTVLPSAAVIGAILGLLGVGLYGLLIVRNLIKLLVAVQILGKATILALVWAGHVSGHPILGH
jgi:multisubunit Na+/H+ antiporter MnhC subunit